MIDIDLSTINNLSQKEYDHLIDKYIFKINKSNGREYKNKYGIISATRYDYIQKKEIPTKINIIDNLIN